MKLDLLQEDLAKGLNVVSRFVSSRPPLPILANILFSAEGKNSLNFSATNLEISVKYHLSAKVEEEGVLAIPAKEISEFVSYLSPGKISLETKKRTQLVVKSQTTESIFSGMDAGEFPKLPQFNSNLAVNLPVKNFLEAMGQVIFSAASDDTRPVLNAVYWQFNNSSYRMVATDGYRLSLKDVEGIKFSFDKKKEKESFLVPARGLNELARLINEEQEIKLDLNSNESQAVFSFGNQEVSSRLIEGEYPDYEKIIPRQFKTRVTLGKEDFLQAVKVSSVFARESANIIKLSFEEGRVIISANAPTVGENKVEFPVKLEGEPLKIAFNYKFILDFLNAIPPKEDEVLLELTESLSPGVFKIASDQFWLHLIMPVKVDF